MQGCSHGLLVKPEIDKATAEFYWPYAALASNVYATQGMIDIEANAVLASSFLKKEIRSANIDTPAMVYRALAHEKLTENQNSQPQEECRNDAPPHGERSTAPGGTCGASEPQDGEEDQRELEQYLAQETNRSKDSIPTTLEDCNYKGNTDPSVPLHTVRKEYGWEEAPELQKYAPARRWSLFVPDLAIDVWRRSLPPDGSADYEYAIVYRGTVGGGGWMSNLRGFSAFTPAVWDQYHQARSATKSIIRQVRTIHAVSDRLSKRKKKTRITFTTVGHSLGAGLAQYIYLNIPQIDKVVGFDPSPLDGTSLIPLKHRSRIMEERMDHSGKPTIFLLYEYGEIMTQLAPCVSGPVWGSEGGPIVECNAANLSRGSPFRQHNMPQLACKLYMVRRGEGPPMNHQAAQAPQ